MRALIWTAVSTKQQTEDVKISLPAQEEDARSLCEQEGWRIVDVLRVPGHSRRYIDIHECAADMRAQGIDAFDRLLELWDSHGFDVLIVRDGDRFARTQTLHAYVTERTITGGARIYSLSDGWVDEHNYRMWIAMSGYKAASHIDGLVKAAKAAQAKRAENGLPTGHGVILGYTIVRDELGKALHIAIDESRRRLYNDAATVICQGIAWEHVEAALYERYGHVNDDGRPFPPRTFYNYLYHPTLWGNTAQFFSSQTYGQQRGVWCFDPDEPRPDHIVIHYGTHEPMYTGETAVRVQAELRRRQEMRGKARPAETYPFSGLLVCAECGFHLAVQSNRPKKDGTRTVYYRCVTPNRRGRRYACTQRKHIREDTIKPVVHDLLTALLDTRDLSEWSAGNDDEAARIAERKSQLESEIVGVESQIATMILKQAETAADNARLHELYERQIRAAAERLNILNEALNDVRRQQPSAQQLEDRVRALDTLSDMTLDSFWELSHTEQNQLLHRLFGNHRLMVRDGKVLGMGRK